MYLLHTRPPPRSQLPLCCAPRPPARALLQAATLADKRLVVAVDAWEADSLYPSGHYVRTLGAIGDRETETEASAVAPGLPWPGTSAGRCGGQPAMQAPSHPIVCPAKSHHLTYPAWCLMPPQVLLIENDINTNPFTAAVHACVPPLPWTVSQADLDDPQR